VIHGDEIDISEGPLLRPGARAAANARRISTWVNFQIVRQRIWTVQRFRDASQRRNACRLHGLDDRSEVGGVAARTLGSALPARGAGKANRRGIWLSHAGHESWSTKVFMAAVTRAAISSCQVICASNGIVRCGQAGPRFGLAVGVAGFVGGWPP
jgi:hypothetical protein